MIPFSIRRWIGFSEDDGESLRLRHLDFKTLEAQAFDLQTSIGVVAGVSPANWQMGAAGTGCLYNQDFLLARAMRFAIQITTTSPITHGVRNATATPIIRKLHMIAPALCVSVRRRVGNKPVSCETMFP